MSQYNDIIRLGLNRIKGISVLALCYCSLFIALWLCCYRGTGVPFNDDAWEIKTTSSAASPCVTSSVGRLLFLNLSNLPRELRHGIKYYYISIGISIFYYFRDLGFLNMATAIGILLTKCQHKRHKF